MKRRQDFSDDEQQDDRPLAKRQNGGGDRQCVLKFLTPEALASAVIGKGGKVISAIRESAQAQIALTERDELYPGTDCRVLTARAGSEQSLLEVATQIISKVAECAESNPEENIGQPGELKLKTLVPRAAGGGIIGKGGSTIKLLRETSKAKISISDPVGPGPSAEQVVAITGTEQAIEQVMAEVNRQVQDVSQQEWFQDWADNTGVQDRRRGHKGHQDKGHTDKGNHDKGHHDKGHGRGDHHNDRIGKDLPSRNRDVPAPWEGGKGGMEDRRRRDNDDRGRERTTPESVSLPGGDNGVDQMMSVAHELPQYVIADSRGFSMSCVVPNRLVGGLIGRAGQGTKEVQSRTGTKITIREIPGDPENRSLNISGPLASSCAAYMLMMKRYLDSEQQAANGTPPGYQGESRSGRPPR